MIAPKETLLFTLMKVKAYIVLIREVSKEASREKLCHIPKFLHWGTFTRRLEPKINSMVLAWDWVVVLNPQCIM
jgi:hypothetical protein